MVGGPRGEGQQPPLAGSASDALVPNSISGADIPASEQPPQLTDEVVGIESDQADALEPAGLARLHRHLTWLQAELGRKQLDERVIRSTAPRRGRDPHLHSGAVAPHHLGLPPSGLSVHRQGDAAVVADLVQVVHTDLDPGRAGERAKRSAPPACWVVYVSARCPSPTLIPPSTSTSWRSAC